MTHIKELITLKLFDVAFRKETIFLGRNRKIWSLYSKFEVSTKVKKESHKYESILYEVSSKL